MKTILNRILCLSLVLLLLPLSVQATEDTFNANAYEMNGGDGSFTVTIADENNAVLVAEAEAGRTADATVDCSYENAYVLHNNAVMASTLADGTITFEIPSAGDYQIISGKLIKIANTNMVFGNSLKMNFWIRKSDIQSEELYAVVTKYYADGTKLETTVPFAQWQNYSASYYRVSCDQIAAKEMSDEVTVQIFHTDKTPASYIYTDSVRSYAMDMLKYYRSGKLATALVDMLNYGAAAQNHFGYNTADLANANLTEQQKALATESVTAENKEVKTGTAYGSSLSLESNIVLNLYFKDVQVGMYAKVEFVDHYGVTQSKTYSFEDLHYNETEQKYAVPVNNLVVADGRQPVKCTLYNADNTVVGTYESNVESYVAIMKTQSTDPLYEATLKFVDSAYAYFHS